MFVREMDWFRLRGRRGGHAFGGEDSTG